MSTVKLRVTRNSWIGIRLGVFHHLSRNSSIWYCELIIGISFDWNIVIKMGVGFVRLIRRQISIARQQLGGHKIKEWNRRRKKNTTWKGGKRIPSIIHHHHQNSGSRAERSRKKNKLFDKHLHNKSEAFCAVKEEEFESKKIPFIFQSVYFTLLLTPSLATANRTAATTTSHVVTFEPMQCVCAPSSLPRNNNDRLDASNNKMKTGNSCTVWNESGKSIGTIRRKLPILHCALALDWKLFFFRCFKSFFSI